MGETKRQFHQHFMSSFCMRRSPKPKKTLMIQLPFLCFWDLHEYKLYINMLVKLTQVI
jgi:hypothetical protein